MTVAVACNLSDGAILGVDSAVTSPVAPNVFKIYENAQKLFQLGDKPIGIAIYGLGALGERSIGSYIREFERANAGNVMTANVDVATVAEQLRIFFRNAYLATVVPAIQAAGVVFDELPPDRIPIVGLVVAGFSANQYLSEVWEVVVPTNSQPNSARQWAGRGQLGTTWFSMYQPIQRYVKALEPQMLNELKIYFVGLLGRALTVQEEQQIAAIIAKYEYGVQFSAMPVAEGIKYVRFLVELVINHHLFSYGFAHQPSTERFVGGSVRIGVVTYRGEKFTILD